MKLNLGKVIKNFVPTILLECIIIFNIYNKNKLMSESETTDLQWFKSKTMVLIYIILSPIILSANSDFSYSISTNNHNPYLKEATILTIDINQTNHNSVMFFNFFVTKKSHYKSTQIDLQENNSYHNVNQKYTYLIYPLTTGDIDIEFNLTQKLTTDDSVAYSFSGDRDNIKGLVTNDIHINIPNLKLSVKSIPKDTIFVGDFKLDFTLKTHEANAYQPIPLNIEIKGVGYPPILDTILPKETNFTQFIEAPIIDSNIINQDTQNSIKYSTALSHNQDFTLESITLKAFNPKTDKSYTLIVPPQQFKIKKIDKSNLIDQIDSPPPLETEYGYIRAILSYLLAYISGFLTAFLILRR